MVDLSIAEGRHAYTNDRHDKRKYRLIGSEINFSDITATFGELEAARGGGSFKKSANKKQSRAEWEAGKS